MNEAKAITEESDGNKSWKIVYRSISQLERERDELRQWKDSAVAVESEWDAQSLASLLKVPLGVSCRKGIQDAVFKLLIERDELRAEVERLTADRNCEKRMRQDAEEARENLAEEVERLKADKARLDWLDSFNNTLTIQSEDGGIWIEIEDYKQVSHEPETSLREAIDAAMEGVKNES